MATVNILLSTLVFLLACDMIAGQAEEISNQCIGCICEAATRCNVSASCSSDLCGPFRISKPYWLDAGSPILQGDTVENPEAWSNCVRDPQCAGLAVFNYITKFQKDCNGDGVINCLDYAWIHHLGGYGCGTRPLEPLYGFQLNQCLQAISQLN